MGNRATVIFTDGQDYSPAVYLHWNGGPESIYGFLAELDRRGIRTDLDYQPARFIHIIGDYMDNSDYGADGLSLGVSNGPTPAEVDTAAAGGLNHWDPGDNGIFIVRRSRAECGTTTVRRWLDDQWLSTKAVDEERKVAQHDDYAAEFRKTYVELRPKIHLEG